MNHPDLAARRIRVRFTGTTHMTSVVLGKRATSVKSASVAASRLGYKAFGDQYSHAQRCIQEDAQASTTEWTLFYWRRP